ITPPPLEAFEQSGVDFDRLFGQWTKMMQDGLDPVALFAKSNMSPEEAGALFAHLRADTAIENNPLRRREIILPKNASSKGQQPTYMYDGLDIASAVSENWEKITAPVQGVKTTEGWSVRIVAAASGDMPDAEGTYESKDYTGKDHPTVPE